MVHPTVPFFRGARYTRRPSRPLARPTLRRSASSTTIYRKHWMDKMQVDERAMISQESLSRMVDLQPVLQAIVSQTLAMPVHERVLAEGIDETSRSTALTAPTSNHSSGADPATAYAYELTYDSDSWAADQRRRRAVLVDGRHSVQSASAFCALHVQGAAQLMVMSTSCEFSRPLGSPS